MTITEIKVDGWVKSGKLRYQEMRYYAEKTVVEIYRVWANLEGEILYYETIAPL